MAGSPPTGRYRLKPGIKLIRASGGGILLQPDPLRALKINRSAFEVLQRCRAEWRPDQHAKLRAPAGSTPFLDTLHHGGLLDWTPPLPVNWPRVSVVVPVYNRPARIEACLASLANLDYPENRIEIIVVDDGSTDFTAAVVRRFGVRLLVQPRNMGQSVARNTGVAAAGGEIIAFLDSDCIAEPGWLRELVPCFQDERVALVGGYVAAYYRDKRMDRYEEACSPLNMGADAVMGRGEHSVFYVPTCNMLVRKTIYEQMGGLDPGLHVGEDVDLCWRLMAAGHHLLYIPRGKVRHRHRSRILPGFLRRFDYGTSEAVLYARFPGVAKQFPWQPGGICALLAAAAGLVSLSWYWLAAMAGILVAESICKRIQLVRRMDIRLSIAEILSSLIKSHYRLAYYLAFYLVRYHLLPLAVLSMVFPPLTWPAAAIVLLPVVTVYLRKRPRLSLPVFAIFYLCEHAFYQAGAFWGCIRQKSFRLYGICFRYAGFIPGPKAPARSRKTFKKGRKEAAIG